MKIAVSSTGGSINALVEERFARAPYYVIVDSTTMRFGLVSNPSVASTQGAGPQAAAFVHDRGATVVLTGRAGPKAKEALDAFAITVVEGASGTVRRAVELYLAQVP